MVSRRWRATQSQLDSTVQNDVDVHVGEILQQFQIGREVAREQIIS